MSDERSKALLKLPVKELVKAGPKAPLVLVRHVIESQGPRLSAEADGHRRSSGFDAEEYVDRLITRQLMLVRGQGALTGLAMVGAAAAAAAEVVAAPLGAATIAAAILGDLATLSYFQIELSLKIAAAYGHDLGDHETRAREILHLHGLEMIGGDNLGPVIGKGGERVGKRLLMRYLKGDALKAAKSLFRFAGIKFTRAGLIKMLPGGKPERWRRPGRARLPRHGQRIPGSQHPGGHRSRRVRGRTLPRDAACDRADAGSPGPDSPSAAVTTPAPTGGSAPPIPTYLNIFDINHPGRPIARLAAAQTAAFSGDGALLAEQVPQAHGEVTRVVRWSDGQIIWQSNGTLAGAVSSPGVPVIAIATYQPGWSSNQIVLVRPDGQSIPVADGQLAGP